MMTVRNLRQFPFIFFKIMVCLFFTSAYVTGDHPRFGKIIIYLIRLRLRLNLLIEKLLFIHQRKTRNGRQYSPGYAAGLVLEYIGTEYLSLSLLQATMTQQARTMRATPRLIRNTWVPTSAGMHSVLRYSSTCHNEYIICSLPSKHIVID